MAFCIVTGSSSGNGFVIAKSLRDRNHQVCGIDIELPTSNNCSNFIKGDVSDIKIIEESFEVFQESKEEELFLINNAGITNCLLYTSPSPRDRQKSRMPSSA